jgi:hypothetical protein
MSQGCTSLAHPFFSENILSNPELKRLKKLDKADQFSWIGFFVYYFVYSRGAKYPYHPISTRRCPMKTLKNLKLSAGKINAHHVRVLWFLLTLTLLVIGAGAPEGSPGWLGG